MSHVDEGTIHAYLDGALAEDPQLARVEAHLAGCADCRAQLEQERNVRERAAYVLGRIAPDALRVEPFEAIAARRHAASAAPPQPVPSEPGVTAVRDAAVRSARRRFNLPLTLAATVVLAITAGLMARQLELFTPSNARAPTVADLERLGADAPRPAEPAPQRGAGTESAAAATSPQDELTRRDANLPAAPPASADPTRVAEEKQAETREQERRLAATTDTRSGGFREAQQLQVRPQVQQQAALGQQSQSAAASAPLAAGVAPDSSEQKKIDDAAGAAWRDVTVAEATRILGRAPAGIEGLATVATQTSTLADQPVVRVIQRLDSLRTVELLQWPVAVALNEVVVTGVDASGRRAADVADAVALRARQNRAEAAREGDATPAVMLRLIGHTVALRGSLSPDSLQSLARRIR